MTSQSAITILRCMMDGTDPLTGEILPKDHLCQHPVVMRALATAILALSNDSSYAVTPPSKEQTKLNAGRPWTKQDLIKLEELYRSGVSITAICKQLHRRERGLKRQLIYLGLLEPKAKPGRHPGPGRERAGMPWTRMEDSLLKEFYDNSIPIAEIASRMHRSEYSIFCRMEKLEFYGEEFGYPAKEVLAKWTNEHELRLREMFQAGKSILEISANMDRTEKNIRARLFYMGLIRESPLPHLKNH